MESKKISSFINKGVSYNLKISKKRVKGRFNENQKPVHRFNHYHSLHHI